MQNHSYCMLLYGITALYKQYTPIEILLCQVAPCTQTIPTHEHCIEANLTLNHSLYTYWGSEQSFYWPRTWKTLNSTLPIHGKQSSIQLQNSLKVIVMFGPTERNLQPWMGVWLFLYLPPCGESQVLLQKPQWKRSRSVGAKSGIKLALWAESACSEHCGRNSQYFPMPV